MRALNDFSKNLDILEKFKNFVCRAFSFVSNHCEKVHQMKMKEQTNKGNDNFLENDKLRDTNSESSSQQGCKTRSQVGKQFFIHPLKKATTIPSIIAPPPSIAPTTKKPTPSCHLGLGDPQNGLFPTGTKRKPPVGPNEMVAPLPPTRAKQAQEIGRIRLLDAAQNDPGRAVVWTGKDSRFGWRYRWGGLGRRGSGGLADGAPEGDPGHVGGIIGRGVAAELPHGHGGVVARAADGFVVDESLWSAPVVEPTE